MPAAAGALPRRSVRRQPSSAGSLGPFGKVHLTTLKRSVKHMTRTHLYVWLRATIATAFVNDEDEEVDFIQAEIAKELGVSDRAVQDAMKDLGAAGAIPHRRRGHRTVICRPRDENLPKLREVTRVGIGGRKPAEAEPDDEPETAEDDSQASAPKAKPIALECPLGATCPVQSVVQVNGLLTNTGTRVPVSPPGSPPEYRNSSSGIDRLGELRAWCQTHVQPRFNKLPDDQFLRKLLNILGNTPLSVFYSIALQRLQQGARSTGILEYVAQDARRSYDSTAEVRKQAELAQAKLTEESMSARRVMIADLVREIRSGSLSKSEIAMFEKNFGSEPAIVAALAALTPG
jgi:hypothetical protein